MKKRIIVTAAITACLALWGAVWPQAETVGEPPASPQTPAVSAPEPIVAEVKLETEIDFPAEKEKAATPQPEPPHETTNESEPAPAVKAAHGGEILPILIALEQLLDAVFDAVNNLPHPVFVGLLFSHDDLLSEKIAPLRRRKHILHRGNSPQIDVVSGLADRMTQPLVIPHEKSLAARGFYALYLRRFQYCSRFRLASCFRRSCLAQAGQYLARLEEE